MNKKYWLRGGMIGAILTFLHVVIIGTSIMNNLFFPAKLILHKIYFLGGQPSYAITVSYIISGFVYGAIIGWFYGKIKNRDSVIQ